MWCGGWRKENENGGGTGMLCIDKYIRKVGTGLHQGLNIERNLQGCRAHYTRVVLLPRQRVPGQACLPFKQASLISGVRMPIHPLMSGFFIPPVLYITPSLVHTRAQPCLLPPQKASRKSSEKVLSSPSPVSHVLKSSQQPEILPIHPECPLPVEPRSGIIAV